MLTDGDVLFHRHLQFVDLIRVPRERLFPVGREGLSERVDEAYEVG